MTAETDKSVTEGILTVSLDGPAAWRARDFEGRDDWVLTLSLEQVAELKTAVAAFGARGTSHEAMEFGEFPLPSFEPMVRRALMDLEGGPGFTFIRGIPVQDWSEAECRIAYWGLGLHLGIPEPQDGAGRRLHDVHDSGTRIGENRTIRYFQTNQELAFHNDGSDAFGLLCIRSARQGGTTWIASAVTVFNEVLCRRPDLATVLQQDFIGIPAANVRTAHSSK